MYQYHIGGQKLAGIVRSSQTRNFKLWPIITGKKMPVEKVVYSWLFPQGDLLSDSVRASVFGFLRDAVVTGPAEPRHSGKCAVTPEKFLV